MAVMVEFLKKNGIGTLASIYLVGFEPIVEILMDIEFLCFLFLKFLLLLRLLIVTANPHYQLLKKRSVDFLKNIPADAIFVRIRTL